MSLIIFLVIGLIAGVLASYIMGKQQDLLLNLLVGVVGLGEDRHRGGFLPPAQGDAQQPGLISEWRVGIAIPGPCWKRLH